MQLETITKELGVTALAGAMMSVAHRMATQQATEGIDNAILEHIVQLAKSGDEPQTFQATTVVGVSFDSATLSLLVEAYRAVNPPTVEDLFAQIGC